jgi:hypothetical protein
MNALQDLSTINSSDFQHTRNIVADLVKQACSQLDAYSKGTLVKIRAEISGFVSKAIAEQLDEKVNKAVETAVENLNLNSWFQETEQNSSIKVERAIEDAVVELTRRNDRNGSTTDRSAPDLTSEIDRRLHEALEQFATGTTSILELEIKPQMQVAIETLVSAQLSQVTASLELTAKKKRNELKEASEILAEHAKAAMEATSSTVVHRRMRDAYSSCSSIWQQNGSL